MISTAGWLQTWIDGDRNAVVVPLDDLIVHDVHGSAGCVCGPEIEELADGGVMYTHQALDGRE